MSNEKAKFHELLEAFDTAVLITRGPAAGFDARPMAIADIDSDCNLWFITSFDSAKVREIENDAQVEVICQNGWTSCVCVSGRAAVTRDQDRIHHLWKAAYKGWFPQGPTDPAIALIQVLGSSGEYWDNTGVNKLRYAYESLKAMATGDRPQVKEGEQHGRVSLGLKS